MYAPLLYYTVWTTYSTEARLLWVVLLCLADSRGRVNAAHSALARTARISYEEYQSAVTELSAPDPYDDNRPTITRTDDGWQLSRWQFDPRKLRDAARQRRHRERLATRDDA